ncbi:MAG: peptidylprolyl isomerase [Planctomycetes bacterium]|nr:peptidylprolyl isomerase [Planctomycetota bacterium]
MILLNLILCLCQQAAPQAFSTPRVLMTVNGQTIHSDEVNQIVSYYQTYRNDSVESLIRRAINTIIPQKLMLALLHDEAALMKTSIAEIAEQLATGADFEKLAITYSQDSEAPTADGRYTFPRESTVHPFDYYSFTTEVGSYSQAFITKYGYHILQPLQIIAGGSPAKSKIEVRHILLMYPTMIALEKSGKDVRAYINSKLQQAEIVIYEIGLQNMLAYNLRDQLRLSLQAPPSAPTAD